MKSGNWLFNLDYLAIRNTYVERVLLRSVD